MRIKIIGKQIDDSGNVIDKIELFSEATFKKEQDFMIFDYEESNQDDNSTTKTRLRISNNKMSMTKLSTVSTTLEFEPDKKYYSVYSTIYGDLQMEIYTLNYSHNLNENGIGDISLVYKLTIGDNAPYTNILSVQTFA